MRPDASENSQISPSTIVRAARAAGSHPTSRQSCCKVGKTQIFTPVRESSGESQLSIVTYTWRFQIDDLCGRYELTRSQLFRRSVVEFIDRHGAEVETQ